MRYSSDDCILDNLPNDKMDTISRVINEGIRRATEKSAPTRQVTEAQSDDPLEILKMRLAKGEISREEFEEMKQLLE
jgi:uncharacterized membrane protein